MTLGRRARDVIVVASILVLAALLYRASTRDPSQLNLVDRLVLRAAAPLQRAVAGVGRACRGTITHYLLLVHAESERERLAGDNARLRTDLGGARQAASRSGQLERLLDLRQQIPAETRAARVIALDTSGYFRLARVRIDRGEGEVKPGMPVLAPEGVVGRVERVFGDYSDVLLTIDPKSSIDVVVVPHEPRDGGASGSGRGVVKGIPGQARLRIEYLLREDPVAEGDLVVTSGLGGWFPRDLPIGRVAKVVKRDFGLYQDAEVEPAVKFQRLSDVLVVLAPPPPRDPEAGKHAEPAHGLQAPR